MEPDTNTVDSGVKAVVNEKKVIAKKATSWILEAEAVLKKFEDQALHLLDHPVNGIHGEVKKFLELIGKAKAKAVVVPGGEDNSEGGTSPGAK